MTTTPSRLYRYGLKLNTHDLIKIVATILMIIDHVGEYTLHDNAWCRLMGRGAAPLFFFLIGFAGKLKIGPSLILYGIILSAVQSFLNQQIFINILLNFIFIDILLSFHPPQSLNTIQRLFFFILCATLNVYTYAYLEYGFLGILFVYCGRMHALKDPQSTFWLLATWILYVFWVAKIFHFNVNHDYLVLLAIIAIILFLVMRSYRLHTLYCPRILLLPGLLLSRYSLEVYFYHVIILQFYFFLHSYQFQAFHFQTLF